MIRKTNFNKSNHWFFKRIILINIVYLLMFNKKNHFAYQLRERERERGGERVIHVTSCFRALRMRNTKSAGNIQRTQPLSTNSKSSFFLQINIICIHLFIHTFYPVADPGISESGGGGQIFGCLGIVFTPTFLSSGEQNIQ